MADRVGHQLGNYRLVRLLGQGGFAEVYLGEHVYLKRQAALKVLRTTLQEEEVEQFLAEAQMLAGLTHPHIVRVQDFAVEQGTPFLVMDYAPRGTIRHLYPPGSCLSLETTVAYVKQVAAALQYAHNRHVIHRDVKPENLLLGAEQHLMLSDFGLALLAPSPDLLSTQEMAGTVAYMAPEQLRGKPCFASDQYALATLTYEWLCGVRPFEGTRWEIMYQHASVAPPPLWEKDTSLPEEVEGVVLKALAKDPSQRYVSVQLFAQALEHASRAQVPVLSEDSQRTGSLSPSPSAASPRVFLSACPADEAFKARLARDLQAQGMTVYQAHAESTPSLPPEGEGMRQAIRAAEVVLLLASPQARSSRLVKEHLRIASMYRRRLVCAWVAGRDVAEALPAVEELVPVIDAREGHYEQALEEIMTCLQGSRSAPAESVLSEPIGEPRNPYKGLRAFTQQDAADFFGRDMLIEELVNKAREVLTLEQPGGSTPRLLAVIGPSGSGKSSVVMAGLLPHLKKGTLPGSETWVYLEPMVPGVHPLESLVLTLAPHLPDRSLKTLREDLEDDSARGLHLLATHLVKEHSKRAVLLLDQFEELFTLTKSEDERQRFIDLLLTAMTEPRGPIVVLLTLRADFYERLMTYPELGRLIQQSQTLVWPMEIDDLRAVIRGPAALPDVQLAFEGNLVGDLLFEVQGQIGALPLLQFTLEQLFERRKEHLLTLQAYRQIGGVKGALAKRAEDTYLALPSEEHRQLARSLFLRLVDPGSTEQDTTRRRAALAEFSLATSRETEVAHQVAAAFLEARLLTTDERAGMPTIEVSHEALIREWTRLSDWLRQSRGDIRLQQTISADAAEWMHHGKPVDRLYRGSQLSEAQAWAERNVPSKDELAFFQAAAAERERQEAVEQSRLARELTLERRVVSRQRLLVAAMSIFSVVVIVLALLAQVGRLQADAQRQQAEMQRQRAELQTEIAGSRALAAQANYALVKNHVDQALLLSLKANQTYNTYDARDSLLTALEYSPRIIRMLHPGLNPPLRGLDSQVQALAFSPDGQTLASFSNFGSNFLWEMKTNEHYSLPSNFNDKVIGNTFIIDKVVVSPNGQSLAALSNPFRPPQLLHSPASEGMWIWDIKTDTQIAQFQAPYAYQAVAFSPDGKTLASSQCTQYTNGSCAQGRILLWEVTSKKPTSQSLITQGSLAVGLVFSPDRKLLVSSNLDGTVQLWNIASKSLAGQLISDAETGNANNRQEEGMAFSPDGKTLALGKSDGTIILWNVASKKPVGSALVGHTQAVQHLAFSPDGKILASGSDDKTLRLWDVATGLPIGQPLRGHTASISSLVFSPDGKMLASGALDGIIILWNLVADSSVNQQLHVNNALGPGLRLLRVLSAISSPDGQVITLGNGDGKILLREGATGKLLGILDATIDPRDISGPNPLSISSLSIVSLAFSSNGRTLAAGRFDGMIFLWDMGTRKLITHFRLETRLTSIVFDPNSRLLASSYESGTILLWDRATEKVLHHLTHHTYSSNPNDPNVPVLVSTVAFSRDGKRLASGDNDTVIFWDVTTGKQIGQPLVGHRVTVGSVAFSPDGHTLASIDKSGTIILWDIETGKAIGQPLFGLNSSENGEATSIFTFSQTGGVNSGFSFSPNGALLVVGSNLGSVSLWDVARHEPFAHAFQGSTTDFVIGAMFSPNGQRLLVISPSSMTSWDINEGSWQTLACRIVNRNFTADEWKQFAKGERYQKVCPSLPVDNSIVSETQLQAHAASQAGHKQEAVLDYTQATQEAMESADASLNNYVCQQGGLDQFAKVVLPACEYAVKFDPNNVDYRDSRGLGRALAGDIQGAIADFQFVVEPSHGYGSLSADQVKERQLWVQELKSGRNPFDAKTLNALRNE